MGPNLLGPQGQFLKGDFASPIDQVSVTLESNRVTGQG